MTSEKITKEERRERSLAIARQMLANLKATEQEAIEEYKNSPTKQALVAELDRKNAERGTPVVKLRIHE